MSLEQEITGLEGRLKQLYDERAKIAAARELCHKEHIAIQEVETEAGFSVRLIEGEFRASCQAKTLSAALFGALTALRGGRV